MTSHPDHYSNAIIEYIVYAENIIHNPIRIAFDGPAGFQLCLKNVNIFSTKNVKYRALELNSNTTNITWYCIENDSTSN